MPIVNADVAAAFNEIADLLAVQGANVFRVRAYRNAARMLSELGRSVKTLLDQGEDLDKLPGMGPDLAGKIREVVATGTCAQLERLRKELPPATTELLRIPGLGPKRVRALHEELGIQTMEPLHHAAVQGQVRAVHGFGPKTEQSILQATAARLQEGRRFKLAMAAQVAQALLAELAAVPGVQQAVAAGSLRRQRETVGDLDLLVTTRRVSPVMERFTASPDVGQVLSRGGTRASVVLKNGLQVDLRAVAPASFGSAWLYFTGSKAHNIALRKLAQDAGLKLNEYGMYRGDERIAGDTEASVYQALGLAFIAPELREDRGEIDAARAHGLQYLAITDHAQRIAVVHGLDADRLARQIDRIDEVNASLSGMVLLKGVEVEILEDGSLSLPHALLQRLDLVVGAVHQRLDLPRDRQTERLLRAMDHPCFSILAHPTGRLIDERPAYDIDLPRVIRTARARGCFLELNAHPARLDLTDLACRMARDEGVLVSIASDAHSTLELDNLSLGVGQARRGWREAHDVLNTRTLQALRPLLDRTMGRGARSTGHAASAEQAPGTPGIH